MKAGKQNLFFRAELKLQNHLERPKLYFMDMGLACYLILWNNPRTLELSAMAGAMFENYVISEIKKSADPGRDALKNFSVLDSLSEDVGEGAVICMTPMLILLDEKNKMIPISFI